MRATTERINETWQEAMFEFAKNKDAETRKKIELFKKKNVSQSKNKPRENGKIRETKIVTYDKLPEVLRICGISISEAFALVGVEVMWPNELFARLTAACDRLPEYLIDRILVTAYDLTPDWHKQRDITKLCPTQRTLSVLRQSTTRTERSKIEIEELRHASIDARSGTTIDSLAFPEVSNYLQVSLHWLLGMDKDITVYAQKPETEAVLNEFSFMSSEQRGMFVQAVERLAESL